MSLETIGAPLPGKVLSVNVSQGDSISEGNEVCILEAMKMEIPVLATVSGTIKEVTVSKGQAVKSGETIVVIEY